MGFGLGPARSVVSLVRNGRIGTSHGGSALSVRGVCLGSVVGGFGYEDDLDVAVVDAGFLLGADGEGGDGLAGGLGEQRGPLGGAVDVVLLNGYGDLGEDVIGGAVGREDEVGLVELVGLVGLVGVDVENLAQVLID